MRPRLLSPLPPVIQIVMPLDPCNDDCLKKLYADGQIFSFMARTSETRLSARDAQIKDDYAIVSDILNPRPIATTQNAGAEIQRDIPYKVALLVPRDVVGKYSNTAINAILAYLALKEQNFVFKVFDSKQEDPDSLKRAYQEIASQNFPFVIALLTQNGVQNLISKTPLTLPTIIPSVHKSQLQWLVDLPSTLSFAGIDFAQQMAMLVDLSQRQPLVIYNDDSFRGEMLAKSLRDLGAPVLYEDTITFKKASSFSFGLKTQAKYLRNAVVMLNTPVVKTGLLLSQISMLDNGPQMLLSSQINFNLSLFMLTQPKDRRNLYIASAIGKINPYLSQYALILGVNLAYDWIGYTSVDALENMLVRTYGIQARYFSEPLLSGQIIYTNTIYTSKDLSFVPVTFNRPPVNEPLLLEEQNDEEEE
ncbi:type 1 periplasmic-binding domain-containing protein [Helicobacter cynogastricus]|uniref:transposase n=1 Tax=Helicobacter cynogastricus TaxID=329937 RepID=UPI001F3B934E|nr:transposase [Helicobacter cynogastricus]